MTLSAEIGALFERRGAGAYFGEPVSMLEHGLQAAHFARVDGAAPVLIVAALLHDIGHLLEDVPADIADWRVGTSGRRSGSRCCCTSRRSATCVRSTRDISRA